MKRASLIIFLVLVPLLSWSFAKPIRLVIPQLNGVVCAGFVCVEDSEKLALATEIYRKSKDHVLAKGIPFEGQPHFVYCSTFECYDSFGGGDERAISYPFLGTIIAPNSWQLYITQHELIHWFQFSKLGAVSTMTRPEWFREGMAYAFSGAPETDIPTHYIPMVVKYRNWHSDKPWADVIRQGGEL